MEKHVVNGFIYTLLCLSIFYSCQPDEEEGGGSILLDEEVTTRDQISERKYRLEQADRILLEVSKDVNARSVVMNAVRSKYYEDESL